MNTAAADVKGGGDQKVPPAKGTGTRAVNKWKETYDVYIGRPSIFGNPFKIGVHGTREEVILRYAEWVVKQPKIIAALPTLRGKRLGCFCKPLPSATSSPNSPRLRLPNKSKSPSLQHQPAGGEFLKCVFRGLTHP